MLKEWKNFRCSTCGGELVEKGDLLVCANCKNKYPGKEKIPEEVIIQLNNANVDKNRCLFDDALEKYELILKKYPDNAEANWGAFLCAYGIIYEEDYDGEYKPTCHRVSERPVFESPYFARLSPENQKRAIELETLRKNILEKTATISPYDVFICYKATEEKRGINVPTKESKWARDIYDMLTHEMKLRVFFAEKSLVETNADYEPHIYAALRSAKFMLVLAASAENVNSVWVKNEWKRFSKYIKDGEKKTLRVLYDTVNPYDLPKELQNTQAINHDDISWGKEICRAVEQAVEGTDWGLSADVEEIDGKLCVECGAVNPMQAGYCKVCKCNQFAIGGVKYCKDCGLKLKLDAKHCIKCGCEDFLYSYEAYLQHAEAEEKEIEEGKKRYQERKKITKTAHVINAIYVVLNLLLVFGYFISPLKDVYQSFFFKSVFGTDGTFWGRCFSWLNVILFLLDWARYILVAIASKKGEETDVVGETLGTHIIMLILHLIVFTCIGGWGKSAAMGGGRLLLTLLGVAAYFIGGLFTVIFSDDQLA